MSLDQDKFSRRSGTGGSPEDHEFWTDGRKRASIRRDGAVEFIEIDDPAAPASNNRGLFFFRDDGAGKTQFCVRFPTGVIQILSTEP
jgi:hypothetical protein